MKSNYKYKNQKRLRSTPKKINIRKKRKKRAAKKYEIHIAALEINCDEEKNIIRSLAELIIESILQSRKVIFPKAAAAKFDCPKKTLKRSQFG